MSNAERARKRSQGRSLASSHAGASRSMPQGPAHTCMGLWPLTNRQVVCIHHRRRQSWCPLQQQFRDNYAMCPLGRPFREYCDRDLIRIASRNLQAQEACILTIKGIRRVSCKVARVSCTAQLDFNHECIVRIGQPDHLFMTKCWCKSACACKSV